MTDPNLHLQGELDAQVWARSFVKTVAEHPDIPTDEGTMLAWFSSAIMAGVDQTRLGVAKRVAEIAYQCAGVGSGEVMADAPDVVMPTERISAGVERVLSEYYPDAVAALGPAGVQREGE